MAKNVTSARRLRTQLMCAVVMCAIGAGLFITGLCVPPIGEIHPSVLTAGGEALTFAGTLFGLDYNYKSKIRIKHGLDEDESDKHLE